MSKFNWKFPEPPKNDPAHTDWLNKKQGWIEALKCMIDNFNCYGDTSDKSPECDIKTGILEEIDSLKYEFIKEEFKDD